MLLVRMQTLIRRLMTALGTWPWRLSIQWLGVLSAVLALVSVTIYCELRDRLFLHLDATLWALAEQASAPSLAGAVGGRFRPAAASPLALPSGLRPLKTVVQYRRCPEGHVLATDRQKDAPALPLRAAVLAEVVRGQAVFETLRPAASPAYRLLSWPCQADGTRTSFLQVSTPLAPIEMTLRRCLTWLLVLDGSALLLAACGGAWLAQRARWPLQRLTQIVKRLAYQQEPRHLAIERLDGDPGCLARALGGLLERVEQRTAAQQRFLAEAAHELRSPLANLRLVLERALQRPRSPQEQQQTCETALAEVERLTRLVQSLLTLSHADSGHVGQPYAPIPLPALVQRVVEAYRVQAEAKQLTLTVTLPETLVLGDEARLYQLLANLLDNACRYTPSQGQIAVVGETSQAWVSLRVYNSGVGIAAEHLPHLFERFYRVESERWRHPEGSGLGLAICREIVQAHGGSIWIESTPGQGSTCWVRLPLACGLG